MVIDNDMIDWRDVLRLASIVDLCTSKLGYKFDDRMRELCEHASDERRRTIVDGYLSRPPELRHLSKLGLREVGDGEHFSIALL